MLLLRTLSVQNLLCKSARFAIQDLFRSSAFIAAAWHDAALRNPTRYAAFNINNSIEQSIYTVNQLKIF